VGKGLRYALDLGGAGGKGAALVIEPGRDAWLAAASEGLWRGCVRMGRGLVWDFVADTRVGTSHARMYLECEPLGTGGFASAAKA